MTPVDAYEQNPQPGVERVPHGTRRLLLTMQPCGADGRPVNGGNHYANSRTVAAAHRFARDVLERDRYLNHRVESVEITGGPHELRGSWVPLTGREYAEQYVYLVVTRADLDAEDAELARRVAVAAQAGVEFDHACALALGTRWPQAVSDPAARLFLHTGEMTGHSDMLWYCLGGQGYRDQVPWRRDALDALGTYLIARNREEATGPVPGWERLWVR